MGCQGSKQGKNIEEDKNLPEMLMGHSNSINCIAKSEDETVLVTGGDDKEARVWELDRVVKGKKECFGTLTGHSGYVTSVDICGEHVVTGSSDKTVKKWDMATHECCFTYEGHTGKVMRVICTGEYIISSSTDNTAKVWIFDTTDIKTKQRSCVCTFEGHTRGVHPIIYIPAKDVKNDGGKAEEEKDMEKEETADAENSDSGLVVTGSADNTARLWSISKGACLVTYRDHRGPIMTMATDDDVKILFTGSCDKTIRSFEISTGRPLKVYEGHTNSIACLAMVNNLMYTGDTDGNAKCWVWRHGDCTCEYKGHKNAVTSLRFYQGILFTGCGDGLVRAFDAKTGFLRKVFRPGQPAGGGGGGGGSSGGGGGVVINCLTLCGGRLYAGSPDGVLRMWDVSSG